MNFALNLQSNRAKTERSARCHAPEGVNEADGLWFRCQNR
jgi:hypothetical protein